MHIHTKVIWDSSIEKVHYSGNFATTSQRQIHYTTRNHFNNLLKNITSHVYNMYLFNTLNIIPFSNPNICLKYVHTKIFKLACKCFTLITSFMLKTTALNTKNVQLKYFCTWLFCVDCANTQIQNMFGFETHFEGHGLVP